MENQEPLFMIVDDEPDMCWALKNILKKSGYNCEKALSGREAMRLLKSQKFHLAFLDVKLPDIEGLELARRIKSIDSDVRIIMISGFCYMDDPAIQKAVQEGLICSFVAKPFLHEEIIKSIELARSLTAVTRANDDSIP
ncbi:MAG: response regulator [Desulfomonilaceae bacterium]